MFNTIVNFLKCPTTGKFFVNPVTLVDGQTYESDTSGNQSILLSYTNHVIKALCVNIQSNPNFNIYECEEILTCPISQKIPRNPVIASDGFIYDKIFIDNVKKIHVVDNNGSYVEIKPSPLTREPLSSLLIPDIIVKNIIKQLNFNIEPIELDELDLYLANSQYDMILECQKFNMKFLLAHQYNQTINSSTELLQHIIKYFNETESEQLLHWLIEQNHSDNLVKVLLNSLPTDVNKKINNKRALSMAIINKNLDHVKILMQCGANIEKKSDNIKPICLLYEDLVTNNESKIFDYIIENKFGLDLNSLNKFSTNGIEQTALHNYITTNYKNVEILEYLIKSGCKANYKNRAFTPILIDAIKLQWPDNYVVVANLIKNGADVNQADKFGIKPIDVAIQNSNEEIIRLLLAANATVNNVYKGITTLCSAIINGLSTSLIIKLIESGAKIDQPSQGKFPIHYAIITSNVDLLRYLIKNGADVNKPTSDYQSPLQLIFDHEENLINMFTLLIESPNINKCVTNNEGQNILHRAIEKESLLLFNYIIKNKIIDVNATDAKGRTPIFYIFKNNIGIKLCDMLETLIDCGADINVADNNNNKTMHIVAANCKNYNKKFTEILDKLFISNKHLFECVDNNNRRPIHISIRHCNLNFTNYLCTKNIDFNCKTDKGKTPLHYLANLNYNDNNTDNKIYNNIQNFNILNAILNKNINVNEQDEMKKTPIITALYRRNFLFTFYLLIHGAKIEIGSDSLHKSVIKCVLEKTFPKLFINNRNTKQVLSQIKQLISKYKPCNTIAYL
jgi:ankyrin repeat protein